MRPKILRILLAASVGSLLATAASAQITDAEQRANAAATPASRSVLGPVAPDSGEPPALSMPSNVLEEAPRDTRGKPVGTCAYDPLDRQAAAACRRRLEIAQTL